jgi:hypothetical protein
VWLAGCQKGAINNHHATSRVNQTEQYRRYLFLRTAWISFASLYGYLDTRKQADLHKFYQPSHQLSKQELATHIQSLGITDPSLSQRAGTYASVLERLFLDVSKGQGVEPSQAWRTVQATYRATISHPRSRDAQLLLIPEGTPLRLKNKPARLVARPILRPEPDIGLLVKVSLEYYRQVQLGQDEPDRVPSCDGSNVNASSKSSES